MALLAEYALTPDVFDSRSYPHEEVGSARVDQLRDVLLEEALVRDLRQGDWLSVFNDPNRSWNRRGLELLKKVAKQNRLRRMPSILSDAPTDDAGWCREAIASHCSDPIDGIIATRPIFDAVGRSDILGCIDRLAACPWWSSRGPSVRLARSVDNYLEHLRLLLACANSLMFMDAHLDPTQGRYWDFVKILTAMAGRTPPPLIEVHRVCYYATSNKRDQRDLDGWRAMFEPWSVPLETAGLSAEVFIWDHFHDRHVITDLTGLLLENGFDTTTDPTAITTWARLSRANRDDVQREFDPASNRHRLHHHFSVGQTS